MLFESFRSNGSLMYCAALYCTALYCTALYCTGWVCGSVWVCGAAVRWPHRAPRMRGLRFRGDHDVASYLSLPPVGVGLIAPLINHPPGSSGLSHLVGIICPLNNRNCEGTKASTARPCPVHLSLSFYISHRLHHDSKFLFARVLIYSRANELLPHRSPRSHHIISILLPWSPPCPSVTATANQENPPVDQSQQLNLRWHLSIGPSFCMYDVILGVRGS